MNYKKVCQIIPQILTVAMKKNSNGKQDNNNNNSEKAAYRDNKYSEKVKEIKTLKTQLVTVEDALKETDR